MAWKPIKVTKEEIAAFERRFKKKARLLLDENLDPALAEGLRALGWKLETVDEVGLRGHDDEDVLAYSHRKNRVLITNDGGFRDEDRFPPHRNPGVVIAPQDLDDAARSLGAVLPIVGEYRELFRAVTPLKSTVAALSAYGAPRMTDAGLQPATATQGVLTRSNGKRNQPRDDGASGRADAADEASEARRQGERSRLVG